MSWLARDTLIGLALLAVPGSIVAVGTFWTNLLLVSVGAVGLGAVLPISYKLVRHLPVREVPLGSIVTRARRSKLGWTGVPGTLVCFSGIDGSGKTTLAEATVEEFTAHDVPAVHNWSRWRPLISYPLMGLLYVTLGWRRKDYRRSRVMRRIWGYFVLADMLVYTYTSIYPLLLRGRVVCVDRYVLDTVVEMQYDELYNSRVDRLLRRLLPTPSVHFLLDLPPSEALERKDDTQEMLDRLQLQTEAESYLRERRGLYQDVGEQFRAVSLDTTRPVDETVSQITERTWRAYLTF